MGDSRSDRYEETRAFLGCMSIRRTRRACQMVNQSKIMNCSRKAQQGDGKNDPDQQVMGDGEAFGTVNDPILIFLK